MTEESKRLDIKKMAKKLRRPVKTLLALAPQNDPFHAGSTVTTARDANWFAKLYLIYAFRTGVHLRRIHYVLVSHAPKMANGKTYENTLECWKKLGDASKHARYIGEVDAEDFEDHRAPPPRIYLPAPVDDPRVVACGGDILAISLPETLPDMPALFLSAPKPHPYHVEVWAEKSTIDDVLDPIGKEYGVNVVTGVGEMSITRCRELVARARVNGGRAVRIGYVSDFDPAGQSMPVATARKIEYYFRTRAPDLDIQLEPIALTLDQCVEYRLPRTPIKATERRAAAFEDRFGAGATELDALEALHPGALRKIVLAFVNRYRDRTFNGRWQAVKNEHDGRLQEIADEVIAQHEERLHWLQTRLDALRESIEREAGELQDEISGLYLLMQEQMRERAAGFEINMPEPEPADEIADPLFDSTRSYVDQVDRYKAHQGKPIARKKRRAAA